MSHHSLRVCALLAGLVLVWGALPYLPGQIDDAFIVFAYAHRIVEQGEIAWNTGVRVEGYSSPLHLLAMAGGALAGFDLAVFSRVLSFVAAGGVIAGLFHPLLGKHRGFLALAVAAWQPFQHWAVASLETTVATLLAAAGWVLVLGSRGQWAAGCVLLTLFSLTRPEGVAWLALGLLRRLALPRGFGRPELYVAAALAGLGVYHVARIAYFGELLPTPYLVKIVAVDAWGRGALQAGRELASAACVLTLVLACRSGTRGWVWLPLLVQVALLVRAGGDWMGHARFLVPGVVATAASAFASGTSRTVARPAVATAAVLAAFGFLWEPSIVQGTEPAWRDPWYLRRPLAALAAPWTTPLLEETDYLIRHVPPGAGAFISDVGLPGNLSDVRVWDGAGLTDRVVAEVIASGAAELPPEMKARYEDDDDVWCIRYGVDPTGGETAPLWMSERFPVREPSPSTANMVWRCRAGGGVEPGVIEARWRRLSERYPSQDWIRWNHARAAWAAGEPDAGVRAAAGAWWLGREPLGWTAFGAPGDYTYVPGRGWPLYANGSRSSLPAAAAFWAGLSLVLDVDDPGAEGAEVSVAWEPACGAPMRLRIAGPLGAGLPPCDDAGERRLVVQFLNDRAEAGSDRNVYVSLGQSGTGKSVTPPASAATPE